MRRLTGRFHLTFRDPERFKSALEICYLHERIKRCKAIIPDEDSLYVVQPSTSTFGLNILVQERVDELTKMERAKIMKILKNASIEKINCLWLERPKNANRFILGFRNPERFLKALRILYSGKRCRVIRPDEGNLLIIQPIPSTPELNIMLLEDFNELGSEEGKEKEIVEKEIKLKKEIEEAIGALESIDCHTVQG